MLNSIDIEFTYLNTVRTITLENVFAEIPILVRGLDRLVFDSSKMNQ